MKPKKNNLLELRNISSIDSQLDKLSYNLSFFNSFHVTPEARVASQFDKSSQLVKLTSLSRETCYPRKQLRRPKKMGIARTSEEAFVGF